MDRLDNGWRVPSGDTYFREILGEGHIFDVDRQMAALAAVKHFRTMVDVGAHIGTWSRYCGERFCNVIAFEPVPEHAECWRANVGSEGTVLFQCAVGAAYGRVRIKQDPRRVGNSGATYMEHMVQGGEAYTIRLDDLGMENVDFLKIDVEGDELAVLTGATDTIARCRPTICIEQKKGFGARFGVSDHAGLDMLLDAGMVIRSKIGSDYVLEWPAK